MVEMFPIIAYVVALNGLLAYITKKAQIHRAAMAAMFVFMNMRFLFVMLLDPYSVLPSDGTAYSTLGHSLSELWARGTWFFVPKGMKSGYVLYNALQYYTFGVIDKLPILMNVFISQMVIVSNIRILRVLKGTGHHETILALLMNIVPAFVVFSTLNLKEPLVWLLCSEILLHMLLRRSSPVDHAKLGMLGLFLVLIRYQFVMIVLPLIIGYLFINRKSTRSVLVLLVSALTILLMLYVQVFPNKEDLAKYNHLKKVMSATKYIDGTQSESDIQVSDPSDSYVAAVPDEKAKLGISNSNENREDTDQVIKAKLETTTRILTKSLNPIAKASLGQKKYGASSLTGDPDSILGLTAYFLNGLWCLHFEPGIFYNIETPFMPIVRIETISWVVALVLSVYLFITAPLKQKHDILILACGFIVLTFFAAAVPYNLGLLYRMKLIVLPTFASTAVLGGERMYRMVRDWQCKCKALQIDDNRV